MKHLNINMDFRSPVVISSDSLDWVPSPQSGVERRHLEREDTESGRATSIVRYAPGTAFPRHYHPGGEEYLVLRGAFSDETGDHGPGSYVRNPPGSSHAPFSTDGCTIFVKLFQMHPEGSPQVVVDTRNRSWESGHVAGHRTMPLYSSSFELVTLDRLEPRVNLGGQNASGGLEILVLDGHLEVNNESRGPRTWLRYPDGFEMSLASRRGALIWMKRGHLAAGGQETTTRNHTL